MKKLTTEDFIRRANIVHGDKYGYQQTCYVNSATKVEIECKIHGVFEQTANDHLRGHNCRKCGINQQHKTLQQTYTNSITLARSVQRRQNTFIKKYGADNPSKISCLQEKKKRTFVLRYGVDNPRKSSVIKDKIKQTWLDKYGVDNPRKSSVIKDKIKQTWLDKYGVDNPSKSQEIQNKIKHTAQHTPNEDTGKQES